MITTNNEVEKLCQKLWYDLQKTIRSYSRIMFWKVLRSHTQQTLKSIRSSRSSKAGSSEAELAEE
jgi:hypothetical protein